MMSHACTLTTKDYTILEVIYERCLGRDDPLRPILEAKLSGACVMFREDIPPTVVTLSSRVAYRIDGGSAETRIITHGEVNGPVGGVLSITLPRGLALLGLAEGQSFTIERSEGSSEDIRVEQVIYQPEAARRESAALKPMMQQGPILRLVSTSERRHAPAQRSVATDGPVGDDPGPSAA
jgi:regulator of nucleoside diphosphate kinase